MRWAYFAFFASFALAGCANVPKEPAPLAVTGPQFPATRFGCGDEPLPPDPATVGGHAASAAAHYENAVRAWGRDCNRKLNSVGSELKSAGQVAP